MKKIMILALGAAGLLGLSACGTNTAILKQNNEPIVLKGEEGLQRLNEVAENNSTLNINQFNEMFFDTDIDYINLKYSDSTYLGVIKIDEEYDAPYYAYYKFNTELYGNSKTHYNGLLGNEQDFEYSKETALCANTEVDIQIPYLDYHDTYALPSDSIEIAEYYQNGDYSFDVTSDLFGDFIEYINSLYGEVGELIAVPTIPGFGGLTLGLGNNNLKLAVTNTTTSNKPILSDEEREQIEAFLEVYPELAREYLGDTLSEIFTVTLEEDSAKLDIHLNEDLINYVADFLEEYVGVSIDVEKYVPEGFDLKLSILFDENMIPTYFDTYSYFLFEIPGSGKTASWSSHSSTIVSYAY